jgi:carboxypeptidase family protein
MTFWLIILAGLGSGSVCLWGGQSWPQPQNPAPTAIGGTVTDASGLVVMGAVVTPQSAASTGKRTTVTDETGYFHLAAVEPGSYTIAVAADGFAPWTAANVVVRAGERQPPLSAVLQTKTVVEAPRENLVIGQA